MNAGTVWLCRSLVGPCFCSRCSHLYARLSACASQFRDAALEVLSCGRYIPRGPVSSGLAMTAVNRRNAAEHPNRGAGKGTLNRVLPL